MGAPAWQPALFGPGSRYRLWGHCKRLQDFKIGRPKCCSCLIKQKKKRPWPIANFWLEWLTILLVGNLKEFYREDGVDLNQLTGFHMIQYLPHYNICPDSKAKNQKPTNSSKTFEKAKQIITIPGHWQHIRTSSLNFRCSELWGATFSHHLLLDLEIKLFRLGNTYWFTGPRWVGYLFA